MPSDRRSTLRLQQSDSSICPGSSADKLVRNQFERPQAARRANPRGRPRQDEISNRAGAVDACRLDLND